jgi:hypothetical protein
MQGKEVMVKDMKALNRLIIAAFLICGVLLLNPGATQEVKEDRLRELQNESQSLSSVLFELAAERFSMGTRNGELPILAVHDWKESQEILKFTDGRCVVVSLPAIDEIPTGLCRYAAHHNSFVMKKADLEAKAGRYKEAKSIYEILLHFDSCGIQREALTNRLFHVARILSGNDTEESASKLASLFSDLMPIVEFSKIASAKPMVVSNLLTIAVKPAMRN